MNKKPLILFLLVLVAVSCAKPTPSPTLTDIPATAAAPKTTETPIVNEKLSAAFSELTGNVQFKNEKETDFSAATQDSKLELNGQVMTGEDGHARLDLSSGTIVRVAPSSLFTLVSNEEVEGGLATKIKLELGKIFIILNGGHAEVETPSGVAAVQGSYLKIEIDPVTGDIKLTCLEGNCSASNPAGLVDFTNGQSVILHPPVNGNWLPPEVGDMTIEEFNEWLANNPEAQKLVEEGLASQNSCSKIIDPPAGSELNASGLTNFVWTETPGATKYILTFINANGQLIIFETEGNETQIAKYLEGVFPDPGSVTWTITPLDASGKEICASASSSFSKPSSIIERQFIEPDIPCDPCNLYGGCYDQFFCG